LDRIYGSFVCSVPPAFSFSPPVCVRMGACMSECENRALLIGYMALWIEYMALWCAPFPRRFPYLRLRVCICVHLYVYMCMRICACMNVCEHMVLLKRYMALWIEYRALLIEYMALLIKCRAP